MLRAEVKKPALSNKSRFQDSDGLPQPHYTGRKRMKARLIENVVRILQPHDEETITTIAKMIENMLSIQKGRKQNKRAG
jgi:hypothetical protein